MADRITKVNNPGDLAPWLLDMMKQGHMAAWKLALDVAPPCEDETDHAHTYLIDFSVYGDWSQARPAPEKVIMKITFQHPNP